MGFYDSLYYRTSREVEQAITPDSAMTDAGNAVCASWT